MAFEDQHNAGRTGQAEREEHEGRRMTEESDRDASHAKRESIESAEPTGKTDAQDHHPSRPTVGHASRAQTSPGQVQNGGVTQFGSSKRVATQGRPNSFQDNLSDSAPTSSSEEESTRKEAKKERRDARSKKYGGGNVEQDEKSYSRFNVGNDFFKSKGRVSKRDGRLKISISETAHTGYVAKALGQSIQNHLNVPTKDKSSRRKSAAPFPSAGEGNRDSIGSNGAQGVPRPKLNIVIMVIGSRGDIQPFLQVGKILKHQYGHRVRIATHPTFRDFVEKDAGLEMFSVGGDPSELMAFMVKNPGLIPNLQTVKDGEIPRRRTAMAEMFEGFWRACIQATDDPKDKVNLKLAGEKSPFIVDAIIANPPSMAHVHIAEKLGVPLHVMFTFPYSPTASFPHPLANINNRKSSADADYVNFMSYPLVEMMTWQGLGDIVNKFRENTLDLEPVSSLWAPGALYRMKVPYTYLWSPSLVPKPRDWGPEIDLAGFVFLDLASDFKPPQDLMAFLDGGEAPVYIGFGSIVIDDPDKFTDLIFKAAELAGVRVLVNKGWGGLGQDNSKVPENVFMLENTPHDWLFPRVKAVVHHGGAGTTAIGLKLGKPTMIIPFFGDQPFWGARVAEAKAGAHQCISYKNLTAERLADGIKQCRTEEARQNAKKIADDIEKEGDGALNAVKSFHRSLPLAGRRSMRCSILQDHVAVWNVKHSTMRLSALAAEILRKEGKIEWSQLELERHYEWNDFDGPGGPFTGGAGALSTSMYEMGAGFGMVPMRMAKHIKKKNELERKKKERKQRREERQRRRVEQSGQQREQREQQPEAENTTTDGDTTQERPAAARHETTTTQASTMSEQPAPLPQTLLGDFGTGVKRTGGALLTMPNDFGLAVAQGFHNAPRLYGDATVRKPVRITGVKSGCTAARKEFSYGIYDAWTGLVLQPKGDWQDGDTLPAKLAGMGVGIGKGVGGFVLKNISAVISPGPLVGQGVIKSIESWSHGPGSKQYIRRAHMIQGQNGVRALEIEEKDGGKTGLVKGVEDRVVHGWKVYEEIWQIARNYHTGPIGRMKLKRERRRWYESGALENVDTAGRTLRAVREGEDLGRLFERHEREIREAEKAREPAMEADSEEEGGEGGEGSDRDERHGRAEGGEDVREDGSEDTVVATPNDTQEKGNVAFASDKGMERSGAMNEQARGSVVSV